MTNVFIALNTKAVGNRVFQTEIMADGSNCGVLIRKTWSTVCLGIWAEGVSFSGRQKLTKFQTLGGGAVIVQFRESPSD